MKTETRAFAGLRAEIANEAARIICEQGVRDYRLAKDKALQRLAPGQRGPVPSNLEIEAAVRQHMDLFDPVGVGELRRSLLATALQAMKLCAEFQPRLVGGVLSGVVTPSSVVQLHLFADSDEAVDLHLAAAGIPYDGGERRVRHPNGKYLSIPLCHFIAGEHEVELAIFDLGAVRWSPLSPIDGKPMARADRSQVARMAAGQI